MRDIIIIIALAIIGFGIGYFQHANAAGVDISLNYLITGSDTGIEIVDKATASLLEEIRRKVLMSTLTGAALGLLINLVLKRLKK